MNLEDLSKKVFDFTVITNKILSQLKKDVIPNSLISRISEKSIEIWETFNVLKTTQDIDTKEYKIKFIIQSLNLYFNDLEILMNLITGNEFQDKISELTHKASELKNEFLNLLKELEEEKNKIDLLKKKKRFPYIGLYSLIIFTISLIFLQLTESDLFLYVMFFSIIGILLQILKSLFGT